MSDSKNDQTPAPAIEARFAELIARFGDRIELSEHEAIRVQIRRSFDNAAALRKTPLINANAPEIEFAPYRAETENGR